MKAKPVDVIGPAVMIRIAKSFKTGMTDTELYEATRGVWRIGKHRNAVRYALAVADGIVREVYEVQSWHPAGAVHYHTRKVKEVKISGRWEFIGKIAPREVRTKYIGHSVAHYFKPGAVNPIQYVEVNDKIARVCWNTNLWRSPSGPDGKSADEDSFEYDTGFGHEEWNFDTDKTIEGYVYGFLQQFNTKTEKHRGKKYNISFYTIENVNSTTRKKWWIGTIRNVEVLYPKVSSEAYNKYNKEGWLAEMIGDLESLGLSTTPFKKTPKGSFFNIKFKVGDMELLDEPKEISKSDNSIPAYYYNILDKLNEPLIIDDKSEFIFKSGHNAGKSSTTVTTRGSKTDKSLLHNDIQTNIYNLLVDLHGKGNVGTENVIGYQTKVDIVTKLNGKCTFYEIKTAQTAKGSIREALGQVFEYAYWPNCKNAEKLIIISPQRATKHVMSYMQKLRNDFKLPIYYQQYDYDLNVLKDLV